MFARIQREIAHFQDLRPDPHAPPGESPQARQQFLEVERLGQVIVGAAVQSGHPIVHRVARRQHEDGRVESAPAQFPANVMSVLDRQHDVQNHQVIGVHRGLVERLLAIGGHVHGVSLFPKAFGNEARHSCFIFH